MWPATFNRKEGVKAVSSRVQLPPLLRQRHNAVLGLFYKSTFGPRNNLVESVAILE